MTHMPMTTIKIGYVPLSDSSPLIAAKELGLFNKHGINVELHRLNSWATVRDKVSLGLLDGAQMLAPLPLAMTLGLEPISMDMTTAFSMGLNGNGITFSNTLFDDIQSLGYDKQASHQELGHVLREHIQQRQLAGKPPLTMAIVHPYSMHNYLLRYWLQSVSIDIDQDINLIVVPPPQMVSEMQLGRIDAYCVGEPWNSLAEYKQVGKVVLSGRQIWNNAPDKVFAVTRQWAQSHPEIHKQLLKALLEAAIWCDSGANRASLIRMLSGADYLNLPEEVLAVALQPADNPDNAMILQNNLIFYRHAANYPWSSHAIWSLTQMIHSGQWQKNNINEAELTDIARQVYASHIYREVAMSMQLPVPTIISKAEGMHIQPWLLENATDPILLGADCFIDGVQFDPEKPFNYLKRLNKTATADSI